MGKKDIFREIITVFHQKPPGEIKKRALRLPLDSGKVITVSGVRRSGKTFLLFDTIARLLEKGVEPKRVVYINFEDERLDIAKTDLDLILQAYLELYPEEDLSKVYFFFDEIQNVEGWEKFVRRAYDGVSKNIFVTGSNSKLLSTDIATSLRGRNLAYEVYPLSFPEFLSFKGLSDELDHPKNKAKASAAAAEYLRVGGFPELVAADEDLRLQTLQGYFNVMLFKDLMERYGRKSHSHLLKYFIKRLLSGLTNPVSIHKIYNELRSQGYKIDKNLLYQLMEELNSIYLFFPMRRYSPSIIKREASEKKFYVVDTGLAGAVSLGFSTDWGKMLENAVFMHFHRFEGGMFFYKNRGECDFVRVPRGGAPEVFQAAYDLTSPDTRQRELAGLIDACKALGRPGGTLITMSDEFEEKIEGLKIKAVPFYKWALANHGVP